MTSVSTPGTGAGSVVGVAIPVPDPWGAFLREQRLSYGESRAEHIPTHLTLLPPTPVRAEEVRPLRQHLAAVAAGHHVFDVVLRGTGTFRPLSDVVYVNVAAGADGCERLERAVRSGPVARPRAFPYHPHVTVVHDVPAEVLDRAMADLAAFTCRFRATSLRLYQHPGDGVWQMAQEYPLRPPSG